MGQLKYIKRKDGTEGYEYLNEEQIQEQITSSSVLPTFKSEEQRQARGVSGALMANEDDNILQAGIKTPLRMAVSGMAGAIQETSDSARYLGEITGLAPEGTATTEDEPDKPIFGGWKPVKPNNDEAWLSGVEDFGTGVVSFAIEWIALSKFLKGANWLLKASKVKPLVQASHTFSKVSKADKVISKAVTAKLGGGTFARGGGFVAAQTFRSTVEPKGLAIDFAGFDPWEGNLATLAANSEIFGAIKHFPFVNELIFDPDDTETQRRFKQMAEGWVLDWTFGGALKGLEEGFRIRKGAELLTEITKANGYSQQLQEAATKFGPESIEVKRIQAKIEKQAVVIEQNPLVKLIENQKYKAPDLQLPRALEQADKNQPLSLFLRTASFEDQAFIAIHRLEEAMEKFVDPKRGRPRQPLDTVGDLVNLLNVARVATEEGVQKALRDVNNLLLPPDQRPQRELLIGVQGWRKRMDAGKLATNRQVTEMLGEELKPISSRQIQNGPPTQEIVPASSPEIEIPSTKTGETTAIESPTETKDLTVDQQYKSKEFTNAINEENVKLKALGDPPPKPGKGESFYQAPGQLSKKSWTPAYKKWRDYQKKAKPIIDKINELTEANKKQIQASALETDQPVESQLNTNQFQSRIESTSSRKKSPDYSTRFKRWTPYEKGWYDDTTDLSRRGPGAWEKLPKSKGVEETDIKQTLAFMTKVGMENFNDVAPAIMKDMPQKGRYDFLRKVVLIQESTIKTSQFKQTAIHELWHVLSRNLPKIELNQLRKEFELEKRSYLENLTKPQLENFQKGEYSEFSYRYKNIDEYFTETMLDLWLAHEKMYVPKPGSLGAMARSVLGFFNQIWNNIKAQLGINATHKIFNNFINQRYSTVHRNTKLEFDPIGRETPINEEDLFADLPDFNKDKEIDGDIYRPGETGTEFQITENVFNNFIENYEKVRRGELDTHKLFGYAMQDIINVQSSGVTKSLYIPRNEARELHFIAAKQFMDRATATDMPPIDMKLMLDTTIRNLEEFGLSLKDTSDSLKMMKYMARTTPEQIQNVLSLRIAVTRLGEIAGDKARNVMNAMNNGTINWNKAVKELQVSTVQALQYYREYQEINRSLGQQFRALQTELNRTAIENIEIIPEGTYKSTEKAAKRTSAEQIIQNLQNADPIKFEKLFGEKVIEALETGVWEPGSKSEVALMANNIADSTVDSGEGIKYVNRQIKGPNYETPLTVDKEEIGGGTLKAKTDRGKRFELFMKGTATTKVSSILSSAQTFVVQFSIPLTRLVTEPALDVFNRTISFPENSLIPFNTETALRQIPIAGLWYQRMFSLGLSSLRMAGHSFRKGQSLVDIYRHAGSFDINTNQNIAKAIQETEGGRAISLDGKKGAYNLNEDEWMRSLDVDPIFITVADYVRKGLSFDIRLQGAAETFVKNVADNSFLYAIGVEEGYAQGVKEGLKGKELWSFAKEWGDAKVDFYTHDAIVNGTTIRNAINSHPDALKFGRMLTFTDDIRATMDHRSFSFGQELARQEGIDPNDFDAINKYAENYIHGTGEVGIRKGWRSGGHDLNRSLSWIRGGDKTIPKAGEETPLLTGSWSFLPSVWSDIQKSQFGWLATQIQPFVRSPSDILKQVVRTIPGLNLTVDTFYRDVFSESAFFSNHWKSELAMGAIFAGTFLQLLDNEDIQLTGAGPLNIKSQQLWHARNMRPMSFRHKFTDENGQLRWSEWQSYRAYEPAATILRTLADFKDLSASMTHQNRDKAGALLVFNLAGEVIKGNLKSTYYQGALDFLDGVIEPSSKLGGGEGFGYGKASQPGEGNRFTRYLSKMIISNFPHSSRVRSITQMIDPYKRVPSNISAKVINEEIGKGKEGKVWEWGGDDETIGGVYPYEKTFKLFLVESFLNEVKRNTPFWSETLPVRRSWVTGDPLYNGGFLHDHVMPLDDEPWLTRLTASFVLTHLPMVYSPIPIVGALPGVTGRTGHEVIHPDHNEKEYVMQELMRLRGFGAQFTPPSADDIQAGVTLSTEAYDQYITYLSQTPDPDTGMTLSQELFQIMISDTYQKQDPDQPGDGTVRSVRATMLDPVFDKFRKRAKWLFINDPENPYVLEVLQERTTQKLKKADVDFSMKYGVKQDKNIKAGTERRVNAREYIESVQ
tara:strand:+ start:4771 stop:11187 length:6417 start_codon:yes stop_codon:yes gene_type:complete